MRRGGTSVFPSLLIAGSLALNFSHQAFGIGIGGGGGGAPTVQTPFNGVPSDTLDAVGNAFGSVMSGAALGIGNYDFDFVDEYQNYYFAGRDQLTGVLRLANNVGESPGLQTAAPGGTDLVQYWEAYCRSLIQAWAIWTNGGTPPDSPLYGSFASIVARTGGGSFTSVGDVFAFMLTAGELQLLQALNLTPAERAQLSIAITVQLSNPLSNAGSTTTINQIVNNHASAGFSDEQPDQFFPDDVALAYDRVLRKHSSAVAVNLSKPAPFVQRWTAWTAFTGAFDHIDGTTNANSISTRSWIGTIGMEYPLTRDTTVGIAYGGANSNSGQAGGSTDHADSIQAAVYGKTHSGPIYLSGWLSLMNSWINTNRFAGGDQIKANFNAQTYSGRLEAGYAIEVRPRIAISPYAAVQLLDTHTPSYNETDLAGGIQAASLNAEDSPDTRGEIGAHLSAAGFFLIYPTMVRATVAWAHDWVGNQSAAGAFVTAPGTGFIVTANGIPKNSAITSLETEFRITERLSLAAKFDGQFGEVSQLYAGTATLRFWW